MLSLENHERPKFSLRIMNYCVLFGQFIGKRACMHVPRFPNFMKEHDQPLLPNIYTHNTHTHGAAHVF